MNVAAVDLPYLWSITVKGRPYLYYRRSGRTTRLPDVAAPDFLAAYKAAHDTAEALVSVKRAAAPEAILPGSLAALIIAYRSSEAWRGLSPRSRESYGKIFDELRERYGRLPVATMPRAFVFKLRDEYATRDGKPTPRRANLTVDVLRLLLSWGVNRGWRNDNPALRPGRLKTGPGYATWKPADVSAFLACEAISESMKRALVLGLYTGQRKGDCLAMTWAAREGGAIEVVQEKTGARVWIPEHPELTRALDSAARGDALTILTRADGKPWKADHFNHEFARAVRAAGLSGLTFHGLRKTAAARLAEAGASAPEIAAITGHRTLSEVSRYTAGADQRRRATAAMEKLAARGLTPI